MRVERGGEPITMNATKTKPTELNVMKETIMHSEQRLVEAVKAVNKFDKCLKDAFPIEPSGSMFCKHSPAFNKRNSVKMKPS